jgi:hypothetical protein
LKSEQAGVFGLSDLVIIQSGNASSINPYFNVRSGRQNTVSSPPIDVPQILKLVRFGEDIDPSPAIGSNGNHAASFDE